MTHRLQLTLSKECQAINADGCSSSNVRRIIRENGAQVLTTVSEDVVHNLMEICMHLLTIKDAEIEVLNSVLIQGLIYQTFYRVSNHGASHNLLSPHPPSTLLLTWAEKAASMFKGKRTLKNLENTVLLAIHFCQPEKDIHETQVLEALEIVLRIVQMIDPTAIKRFTTTGFHILRKLEEKASRKELSVMRRIIILDILLAFPDSVAISGLASIVRPLISDIITITSLVNVDMITSPHLLMFGIWHSFSLLSSCVGDFQNLLGFVIEQCRPVYAVTPDVASKSLVASLLLESLDASLREYDEPRHLYELLIEAVDHNQVPDWSDSQLTSAQGGVTCQSHGLCCSLQLGKTRLEAANKLAVLVLQATRAKAKTMTRNTFDRVVPRVESAVRTRCNFRCVHSVPTTKLTTSPTRAMLASDSNGVSLEWHRRLDEILSLQRRNTQHGVAALVDNICLDLRQRCDNVERPLRAAVAKSENLQLENDTLRKELENTKSEAEILAFDTSATAGRLNSALAELTANSSVQKTEGLARAQHHNYILHQLRQKEQEIGLRESKARDDYEQLQFDSKIELLKISDVLDAAKKEVVRLEVDSMWQNEQIGLLHDEMDKQHAADVEQIKVVHEDEIAQLLGQIEKMKEVYAAEKATMLQHLVECQARYQRVVAAIHD